jgi:hypothetical protein
MLFLCVTVSALQNKKDSVDAEIDFKNYGFCVNIDGKYVYKIAIISANCGI